MNTHCFRLIFSKTLGFLIPVAETTRAQRKPGQTAGPSTSSLICPAASSRQLVLSALLAGLPGWAAADILVDTHNPSATQVINAANGVPVIEISNPNDKGLSHNRFTEFDVQKPGVIFNNSLVNGQSQLGGAVLRNPNLQRTATAILSEVTGNKQSSISGTLEVFGAPADLLVANPNGVTVNGVTTLNTSSLTLSTGHVKDATGSLQFLVDERSGQVVIGADGVNTAGLSFFDIVARSVALQGRLGSDALLTDLQITAGQGTYDSVTGAFTAKPGAQGSGLAVSGDAAGAMHGRFITLISTDSGAGVRQDGLILAAKDIAISADGDIQLNNTTTKGQAQIASTASFINAGTLEANTTQIKARDVVNGKGATLSGTAGLTIEATKSVSNNGGKLIGKTVSVKADTISNTNKSQILGTDITLKAETAFTHDGNASIVAAKDLSIDTTKFTAITGELLAGNSLTLAADSYQNSATISSKNNASLTLKHGNDLVIDTSFKGPQAGGLLALSARDVTITDELNNAGSVAINASRDVRNQGAVIVGKTLAITAKGLIDNQAGKLIWAGENLVLDAGTQLLNGENSQLLSMGDMSLSAGEKVQNNVGRIEAQKNMWIDTPLLENLSQSTGGLKQIKVAEEDHYFGDSYGTFDWTQYFRTRISLPVFASDLTVKQAVIKAGGDLQLNADKAKDATAKVRNVGGLIAATGDVQVKGDLENVGLSTTRTLVEALKSSQTMTRWTSNDDLVKDESPTYGTLYELLERTYGGPSNTGWTNSLQLVNTPEVNQLLSAVLGADWKALDRGSLQARWRDFKFSNKTQPYYADQQAEISAGNAFVHTDGTFANGDGTNAGAQRPITIKVGSETVQSLDGELDAQFNLKRADAERALNDLLGNPLFQKNQSGDAFGRIKPLYETRAKYLDQSQFLGSDYFLQKIGYDPQKTVSVLGDAYFDNQLILQSVEQRVGNFFAQTQRISGTDLAKQLLDNGAALALKEGLTLGQPLSGAQIAGLDKDVVWYESREVDGQMVLAPRVYLSQKTLAARDKDANSAALVSADVVLIDANTVNNINGTVRGNTDTFVYAKTDINNVSKGGAQAGFFAGESGKNAGQLVIAAEGTVKNQGGVMRGFDQTVVGGKGISSSATTGYDKNGSLVVRDNGILGTALSADKPAEAAKPELVTAQTTLADTAKPADQSPTKVAAPDVRAIFNERLAAGPVDTTQGSSLNVISGGDIDLIGAITQSDNVSLQTSGNLNLNDLHEARSAFDSASGGGFLSSVHIQEKAASANSVGNTLNAKNLQINAQGNLNITGGEINAQNSAIEVGGDSTIQAGKDLAFHEKTTKTTQLVFGGGAGAAGYEVTGSFGSAAKIDTHLGGAFAGSDGDGSVSLGGAPVGGSSPRGDVYAGRAAATQTLASNGTGARSGANKGRGGTSGANLKIGLETVTTTDTSESATYRNAQLNLGNGSVKVGGTLDIGGADINAGYQLSPEARAKMTADQRKAVTDGLPTLAISAGDIKTTKVENTEKTTHSRDELFIGVTSEVHSSAIDIATQAANLAYKALGTDVVKDPNAPAGSSKTLATEDRKMDVDPALTALAVVGMVTQAAFGEVAGQSTTFGIKHTEQKSDSTTRSENINQLGGNIRLTSTKGDIELNGVNLLGGKVGIKSAGNLTQRAAKSSTVSHDSTNTQSAGLTTSIGISPTGAGMGVSFGADGSGDKTTTNSTSYTNGLISGTEVSIETAGDHNLIGSNIKGNEVAVKVGGNQNITSVQDTSDMTHERNNWSASVGVAITTSGLVQGTGSASVSYGEDFDRSKLVAEQAGISGDKLDLNVAGNLNLTGAHITSQKGQGTVQVGGNINAQTLQDTREKDGGYGGGGGGISKNGLASVTLEFGRVDQVHYNATNAATIDVGDPTKVTAAKGISGPLNTNADSQLNVTQNKRVAGTDVKIEISPGDAQEIKGGVKKLLTRKTGGGNRIASGPKAADTPKQNPQPDATHAIPNVYTDAPKAKPTFDQRVIVNADPTNSTVNKAVQNLTNKNPGNTVVITPNADGTPKVLQGTLAGGTTKVEFVGHGDGNSLSKFDSNQITDVVKNLAKDGKTRIDKLNLVGCGTACAKDGPSLVNDVSNRLQQLGLTPQVKGYETAISVNEKGRKQPAQPDAADALGNGDPAQLPGTSADGASQPNVAMSVKKRWLREFQPEQAPAPSQPAPPPAVNQPMASTSTAVGSTPLIQGVGMSRPSGHSLLGKRSAQQAGAELAVRGDNAQRIQSLVADIEQTLSQVKRMVPLLSVPTVAAPVMPVDKSLLPTFLWDAPAIPVSATIAASSAQPAAKPLGLTRRTLPESPAPGSARNNNLPVAHVAGQQRAPKAPESSASPTLPTAQRQPVSGVLANTPTAPPHKEVINSNSVPGNQQGVEKDRQEFRVVANRKTKNAGEIKGLFFDWVREGGQISDSEAALNYARSRIPEKKGAGSMRRTLEIMQEVAAGGSTAAGNAVDDYWRSLKMPEGQRPNVMSIAEKHKLTYASLKAHIVNRLPMYDLFHAQAVTQRATKGGDSTAESSTKGDSISSPSAEVLLAQQRNKTAQPAQESDGASVPVFALIDEGNPPRKPTAAEATKQLMLDWLAQGGQLDDHEGLFRYVAVQGGNTGHINRKLMSLRRVFGERAGPGAQAAIKYFKLKKIEAAPSMRAVAKEFGVDPSEISITMNRFRDYMELITPRLDADPSTAGNNNSNFSGNKDPMEGLSLNKKIARSWLERNSDVDINFGVDQYVMSHDGNLAAVSNIFRGFRDVLSEKPEKNTQAALEYFKEKEAAKKFLVKAPTVEKLAMQFNLRPPSLTGTINKLKPYIDLLLPLRASKYPHEQRGVFIPVANEGAGGGRPDTSPAQQGVSGNYIDTNNPPTISLEPREDSNSPRAGEGAQGAIDVDSLADEGFRTHIKSEPRDDLSPTPATPPHQPDYLDVTNMDVGDARPWLKTEPDFAQSPTAVDPVEPDAPVKEEVPVVRHTIDNSVPVLQDEHGKDVLVDALQPPQKHKKTKDVQLLVARQSLGLGFYTKQAIRDQAAEAQPGSVLQARRDTKRAIVNSARELLLMKGSDRATYMDELMTVDDNVPNKGRGVRAAKDMPAFTVLAPYAGRLLSGEESISQEWKKPGLGINFPSYLFATNKTHAISAFGDKVGNVSSLLNEGDTPADNNVTAFTLGPKLVFFMTERPVKAGESLEYNYGPQYDHGGWPTHPMELDSDASDESDSEATAP